MNPALNVMFTSVIFMSINMNYLLLQHTSMDIVNSTSVYVCTCRIFYKKENK